MLLPWGGAELLGGRDRVLFFPAIFSPTVFCSFTRSFPPRCFAPSRDLFLHGVWPLRTIFSPTVFGPVTRSFPPRCLVPSRDLLPHGVLLLRTILSPTMFCPPRSPPPRPLVPPDDLPFHDAAPLPPKSQNSYLLSTPLAPAPPYLLRTPLAPMPPKPPKTSAFLLPILHIAATMLIPKMPVPQPHSPKAASLVPIQDETEGRT